MKTMSIREFGKKSNKNMNEAPLIITKGGKKAFVILPYSLDKEVNNPNNLLSFVPYSYQKEAQAGMPTFREKVKKLLLTKLF